MPHHGERDAATGNIHSDGMFAMMLTAVGTHTHTQKGKVLIMKEVKAEHSRKFKSKGNMYALW